MNEQHAPEASPDIESRLARLTPGQQACLLLVIQRRSSKEIARDLGISPHTVDQRMRSALKTLGVDRRTDAARLLEAWMKTEKPSRALLPFATRGHRVNDMNLVARLFWIAAVATGAAFAAGIFLATAEALAEIVRHW